MGSTNATSAEPEYPLLWIRFLPSKACGLSRVTFGSFGGSTREGIPIAAKTALISATSRTQSVADHCRPFSPAGAFFTAAAAEDGGDCFAAAAGTAAGDFVAAFLDFGVVFGVGAFFVGVGERAEAAVRVDRVRAGDLDRAGDFDGRAMREVLPASATSPWRVSHAS